MAVIVGVIAVVVLFAAAITVGSGRRSDRPDGRLGDGSSSAPEVPAEEMTFDELVSSLSDYVAETRGLEFQRPVTVALLDDAEFEARLLEDFEEDAADIEDSEVFLKALGLIDAETELVEELRAIYSAGVLGFYDPETDELVVRGAEPTPYVQQTIVHELVHALDDQHFELFRPEYDDRDDEVSTGFDAVVEGNARSVEDQWLSDQSDDVREAAATEEESFGSDVDFSAFPQILLFLIGAPYELGPILIEALVDDGGEQAVDDAIVDPPTTSEQVLFPELYLFGEGAVDVPPPPVSGPVVEDGVLGALFLLGLLSTEGSPVEPEVAGEAVRGWGGDWAISWRDGTRNCLTMDVVGDTATDLDEIEQALTTWAQDRPAVELSRVDGRLRMESCDGARA